MAGPKRPNKAGAGWNWNKKARSCTQSCSDRNWVELEHSTEYPDDRGQSEPAAFTPFRVTFGDGKQVDGQLDQKGFARFDDIPKGDVHVEYEPSLDQELTKLQTQLKQGLDEIIAAERAEYQRIEKEHQSALFMNLNFRGSNTLAKFFRHTVAISQGFGKGAKNTLKLAWELGLRISPITAPLRFKEDLQALKSAHEELRRFTDEELEAYVILMSESSTYSMFQKFVKDYIKAQHPLEASEAGGELIFDVVLSMVTGGAGLAANSRHVVKLKKLKEVCDNLVDVLKRKQRRQRRDNEPSNRIIITKIEVLNVACFCPYRNREFKALTDKKKKAYLEEYARQLQRQEDALNKLTAEDYLAARDAFNDYKRNNPSARNHRNPLSKASQEKTRQDYEEVITASITRSLIKNKNPGPSELTRALYQAQVRAEEIMKDLAALHDPDMILFWDKHETTFLGSSHVNSAIGGSWNKNNRLAHINKYASDLAKAGHAKEKIKIRLKLCAGKRHCPK
jgi:hypothetical protein